MALEPGIDCRGDGAPGFGWMREDFALDGS